MGKKRKQPSFPLPAGVKIVVPQPKHFAAKREAIRRDIERFGEENILIDPKDCKGKIVENVKMDTNLYRDQCVESK